MTKNFKKLSIISEILSKNDFSEISTFLAKNLGIPAKLKKKSSLQFLDEKKIGVNTIMVVKYHRLHTHTHTHTYIRIYSLFKN